MHTEAWNEVREPQFSSLAQGIEEKIDRDSWGHSYLTVRGEILELVKDGLVPRHLPRMFSLIKIES